MSNLAFVYALGAGVSLATYIVGARLGSSGTHPALGTTIVTGIAFLLNLALTLSLRITGAPIVFSMTSVYSLVVVGVATACVNLFTLLAYASGLRVTSSFVIGGTSTLLVLLVGFMFLKGAVHVEEAIRGGTDCGGHVPAPTGRRLATEVGLLTLTTDGSDLTPRGGAWILPPC